METLTLAQTTTGAPCYRYLGGTRDRYIHPEGTCACLHGGPAPIIVLVAPFTPGIAQAA